MRQLPRHFVGTSAPGFVGKQWRVLLFASKKVCVRKFACSRVCDSERRFQHAAKATIVYDMQKYVLHGIYTMHHILLHVINLVCL